MTRAALLAMDRAGLRAVLRAGRPIDPDALADTAYRGVSLGLPAWVDRVAWKTFQKVFHRDPRTGRLRGWNVRVEQRGVDAPSTPRRKGGVPVTFGHFAVVPLDGRRVPLPCGEGLLLDYGAGGNAALDPVRWLRDPIVAVVAGSAELLLGWSYLDLGVARVGTPSFFTLEREAPLDHVATPAASR
jgi:hypothetical protein